MDKSPSVVQFLASNPWVLAATFVLTIASFIFSIYTYQKQKKIKQPTFYLKTFSIIPKAINTTVPSLKISYLNKEIKSLSITRIVFFNSGSDIINKDDVSSKEPLRITLDPNLEIFEAKVIYSKNQSSNDFSIVQKGSDIHLLFDYLAKNEGGVIQIIHTGYLAKDVDIKGNIKGVSNAVLKTLETYDSRLLKTLPDASKIAGISAGVTLGTVFLQTYPMVDKYSLGFVLGTLFFCTGVCTVALYYLYLDAALPKEYKSVIEQPWQI